jgi:hypothetical protein
MACADGASAGTQAAVGWVENAKVGGTVNTKTGDGVTRENVGERRRHEIPLGAKGNLRTPFLIPNKNNRLDKCKLSS